MRAYEFPAKVTSGGKLELPESVLKHLPTNEVLRVIVLVNEQVDIEQQADWNRLTSEQFLAGYNEADAIYDRI